MLKFFAPLLLFFVLAIFLAIGLQLNPRDIPSPLIEKPAPVFDLPDLASPEKSFSNELMKGQVYVLNVWASWCVSCRAEHTVLNRLAAMKVVHLVGLNYKDEPQDARRWLQQLGNPYYVNVIDYEGRTGIDYGVYGVPETYIVDKKGVIRYKHTGPVADSDIEQTFLPMIKQLKTEV